MKALPAGDGMVTAAVVLLFVLGMLYQNWIGQVRDWIHAKVAEGA